MSHQQFFEDCVEYHLKGKHKSLPTILKTYGFCTKLTDHISRSLSRAMLLNVDCLSIVQEYIAHNDFTSRYFLQDKTRDDFIFNEIELTNISSKTQSIIKRASEIGICNILVDLARNLSFHGAEDLFIQMFRYVAQYYGIERFLDVLHIIGNMATYCEYVYVEITTQVAQKLGIVQQKFSSRDRCTKKAKFNLHKSFTFG